MKKILIALFALALVAGPMGALAANPETITVTVNVAEALQLTLNSANTLTFNLDPSTAATDVAQTSSLTVKTNSADGYNLTYATTGNLNTNIGDADWSGMVAGSQKGFYVTSDDAGTLGANLIAGQQVILGTLPTGNAGETATITNMIAVDWSVADGNQNGTIVYTAVAIP